MQRHTRLTHDAFLIKEEIGPNQGLTPEGFLLCRDVAIARTGTLLYLASEIPVVPDEAGYVRVQRIPEEVFAPSAISSFEGKPVTNLHPDELVNPSTWSEVAVGTVQNVRQDANLLVADLLITEADAIRDIQSGLREVSCGYEAEYEATGPGEAIQRAIVGNHVALVPKGRCGSICSIKDNQMKIKDWKERLLAALKTNDQNTIRATVDALPDSDGGDLHIHLPANDDEEENTIEARVKRIEEALSKLTAAKDAEGDDPEKKDDEDDEDYTGDYNSVVSKAAIIAPGIHLSAPTGDAKSKVFKDAICGCKLQALRQAYSTDAGRRAIDPMIAGKTLDALKGAQLAAVFDAVAVLMAQHNNTKDSKPRSFNDAVRTKNETLVANIAKMREQRTSGAKF